MIPMVDKWFKKYGNIVGYYRGYGMGLMVKDLDFLRAVLIKDFNNFINRPAYLDTQNPLWGNMLLLKKGEDWRRLRRFLTPLFTSGRIRQTAPAIHKCLDTFLDIMEEHRSRGEDMDLYAMFQGLTLDVIGRSALAMQINCQRDQEDSLLVYSRKIFTFANNSAIVFIVSFPELSNILSYLVVKFGTRSNMERKIVENLKKVIEYRQQHPEEKRNDLLQMLIDASLDTDSLTADDDSLTVDSDERSELPADATATQPPRGAMALNELEVMSNAYLFLAAGYETTANALGFAGYVLADREDLQQKIFEEISQFVKEGVLPTYDDIKKMSFLDIFLQEVLRFYPPVPAFVLRKADEEWKYGDITVPTGTSVHAPIYNIHHDPDIWPDPETFDPDRFLPEQKSGRHPLAYMPFGAGPRNCIGARFALMETKLAIVRVLTKYRLIPSERLQRPLQLTTSMLSLNPLGGVWVRVEKR